MTQIAQFAKFAAKPAHGEKVLAALEEASLAAAEEQGTLGLRDPCSAGRRGHRLDV